MTAEAVPGGLAARLTVWRMLALSIVRALQSLVPAHDPDGT